ncbi:peptidoglycan-binding protein [Halalkalibacter oceani]|uniref:peptidoglycan-binding protein n=1 Tax=Halalkalibacter oceani TaxID=1653776 RepID=UPI00255A0BE2|nr:peptidoglycan-binding protein [Halalkalibacter oceani]
MKPDRPSRFIRRIGLPIAAAGVLFFTQPALSEAEEPVQLTTTEFERGIEHHEVGILQQLLAVQAGIESLAITDKYDADTEEAVKRFQEQADLPADGIAGPHTLGALLMLSKGDQGALVEELQKLLQEWGYDQIEADGIFGPLTKQAVEAFQASQQIAKDGIAGPQTYAKLAKVEQAAQEAEIEPLVQAAATEPAATDEGATVFEMEATAYTADCQGCSGMTATGINLHENRQQKVIAVDPDVIPLGTRVYVEGYGEAIAGDTGGAIKGNKIDLHVPTKEEALSFGRRTVTVTIIE